MCYNSTFLKEIIMKKIFFASLALGASLFAVDNDLVMATTTSTDNTGLLDAIYPAYKAETGVESNGRR